MIAIIDYKAGNLHSVKNALNYIGADSVITSDAEVIENADGVILPGVGSFKDATESLETCHLTDTVKNSAISGKPFLGICLGLQLLFEGSDEAPGVKGLSVFKGRIKKIPADNGLKVPHIGFNSLDIIKKDGILKNTPDGSFVYFVHSYYLDAEDKGIVAAKTHYGVTIDAAVEKDNLFACQFHPEKSGETGLNILREFTDKCMQKG